MEGSGPSLKSKLDITTAEHNILSLIKYLCREDKKALDRYSNAFTDYAAKARVQSRGQAEEFCCFLFA